MRSTVKIIFVAFWLSVFSLSMIISAYAGSGGNQPGPTPPPPKLLPDLKVESLYFDKKCNLMVKLKNVGPGKFIGSMTGWRVFMGGEWVGSASHNLKLFPNSTVKLMTLNSGILGVWVTEVKNWKYIVNEEGPIQGSSAKYVKESDHSNNSITKKMMCKSLNVQKPPKKAYKKVPTINPAPMNKKGMEPLD